MVVERCVDFVQHADRRGVGEEHREDQRQRRQCLFAAREQRQRLRFLARRLGDDLKAGFQRIVALDQVKRRLAAAEQLGEQPLEMGVDGFERGQKPLARLAVEALDAGAQLLDRFDEVVALGGERGVLGFDLAQLLLGAQVDGAEAIAVAAQLFQLRLDLRQRRQVDAVLHLGQRRHRAGLDLEHVADFPFGILQTTLAAVHAFLGAGGGFARARQRLQRDSRGAIGFRHRGFGGGERIGCVAPILLGVLDLADDGAALFREQRRRVVELGVLRLHLGDARFDGRDLRGRTLLAGLPFVTFGRYRLQAAVRKLGFARQRLRFRAHLRRKPAMAIDLGPHLAELRFGVEARRQLAKRGGRGFMGGGDFRAVAGQAVVGFGQRGAARRVAVDLALGAGMTFARGVGLALRRAPGVARLALGRGGCGDGLTGGGDRLLGRLQRLPPLGHFRARALDLALDIGKTRALGEAARRAGRGVGRGHEAVPAPDVAFQRYQPLAGLEMCDQFRAALFGDDSDLGQTPRQFGRRVHVGGKSFDALGQRRVFGRHARTGPAHRRGLVHRCVEVVAKHGADRLLVALVDADAVDDRRPQVLAFAVQDLGDGLGFGFEPLGPLVGFLQWSARRFDAGAGSFELPSRGGMFGLAFSAQAFRLRERLLRALDRRAQRIEIAEAAGLLRQRLGLALHVCDLLIDARQTVAMGPYVRFELVTFRGEVGQRAGQFRERGLCRGEGCFRLRRPLVDAAAGLDARLDLLLQLGVLGLQPPQGVIGIGGLPLLALDVGCKLRQPAIEFGGALLRALLLAVERLARAGEALQSGGGAGFRLAQRRQFGRAFRLEAGGFRLLAGAFGQFANVQIVNSGGFRHLGLRVQPAQVEQHGLGLAHFRRDVAIADRLPRLLLEAIHLAGELADHVLDAGEIGFGGLQPQFGFMASCMQAGDAGGVLQHATALFGLGLDDLADLALMHQRRRTRAGGGVGEQDLHVAGANVAAVDAIDRAGLALDPA